jgi:NAD(P)-dependent dehydrogenase (short-subunit alcohol dehydrogenase family)
MTSSATRPPSQPQAQPVVLVTGASRRLGRATALDFAQRGWATALHTHHAGDADAATLAAEIRSRGGIADLFPADLADPASVASLVPAVAKRLGAPHCLINNASMFVYDDITSITSAQWDAHFAINLKAPVFLAQAMAAHLPAPPTQSGPGGSATAPAHGVIINLIDQRVWKPTPHFLSYSGAKSGLWAMTQTLAQALAPRIRVNAIGPGPMLKSIHQSDADFQAQCAATPLGRGTSPDEIVAAIRFILDAPAMTGQMIALDGGQHLAWQTPDIGDGRG